MDATSAASALRAISRNPEVLSHVPNVCHDVLKSNTVPSQSWEEHQLAHSCTNYAMIAHVNAQTAAQKVRSARHGGGRERQRRRRTTEAETKMDTLLSHWALQS